MKLKALSIILTVGVMAGCSGNHKSGEAGTVDVAGAIANPTEITTSQLGSKIRFVPLETTDSSLVGNYWTMAFTDDRAIVTNLGVNPGVLTFDLADGKFLNSVGQIGSGPEDYYSPYFLFDPSVPQLIFGSGVDRGYISYSPDGEFLGRLLPGHTISTAMMIGAADSVAYTMRKDNQESREFALKLMRTTDSEPIDSFIAFPGQPNGFYPNSFYDITINENFSGPLRHSLQQLGHTKNQGKTYIHLNLFTSHVGDQPTIKEAMCDTVYRLTPEGLVPELVFDMGGHNFPVSEVNRRTVGKDDLIVTDVVVTPSRAVFGISRGWIGDDDHELFIGTYDRLTGQTRIVPAATGITDDLGGFLPFAPAFATPRGDLIGVLTPDNIEEWYEQHPDFPRPDWLKNVAEDANPVLVIVSE